MAYPSWWGSAFERLATISQVRIAVVRWDGGSDATVVWTNPSSGELLGMAAEDVAGRPLSEVYPARYIDDVIEQFRRARDDGSYAYEVVRELPTGRRTLDAVTASLGDDLFVSIAMDVTAQHETQRRLEEVTRLTGTGLYHWNVAEQRVEWSDELFRLLGYEPGTIEPSIALYVQHVHPDDRAEIEEATAASRAILHSRHRLLRRDGEERTVDVRAQPVDGPDGQLLYVLGVIRDVTDEVELERHAELARRAAEQQRTALAVHDRVVQSLATVILALDLDDPGTARAEAVEGIAAAQSVVADLLDEVAAVQGTIAPGALRVGPAGGDPA